MSRAVFIQFSNADYLKDSSNPYLDMRLKVKLDRNFLRNFEILGK